MLAVAFASGCAGAVPPASSTLTQTTKTDGRQSLPSDIDVYASTKLAGGARCEVGARLTGSLLQEHPVVYFVTADGEPAWHTGLRIPQHFYQGRATHCVASDDRVYVLVQLDTDSRQALNQTVLRVVALNSKTGARIASREVNVPGVVSAYTAWVDEGDRQFKLDGSRLVIAGQYQLLVDRGNASGAPPTPFVVKLPANLRR